MKKLLVRVGLGAVIVAASAAMALVGGSSSQAAAGGNVVLQLTYPAGESPKVFTSGWVFGARCTVTSAAGKVEDLSSQVRWEGTGTFKPAVGAQSHPTFEKAGKNTIKLTATVGKEDVTKEFTVEAVSPEAYARVGDMAVCAADAHGCNFCPHHVEGLILTGSPEVLIDGRPAARVGDVGNHNHFVCCGSNKFEIAEGDAAVLIDGKPAARIGDKTKHCGGIGTITKGPKSLVNAWTLDGEWYLIITQHKTDTRTVVFKPGQKGSESSYKMPDEKAKRTFRQHASDVTVGLGRDVYQIESFEGKSFKLQRVLVAGKTTMTYIYTGTFGEDDNWNGDFLREVALEIPEYTTKETETYHIEAWRLATYKGNVPQPIKENMTKFGL
jgi:uncharacterized Zn-binding protein involved in type VI secretion